MVVDWRRGRVFANINGMKLLLIIALSAFVSTAQAADVPNAWSDEWPQTDFDRAGVALSEITSGGPPKDGIPAIDHPKFRDVGDINDIGGQEPVIVFEHKGDARAYPLRVLMWHEIANDTVGGLPVVVTYCPLCNSSIVFGRTVSGKVLDFGTTGKLRNSDLVMYDRQTESWWQQFSGQGIVGELTGTLLDMLPSQLLSFEKFAAAYPKGRVLVPTDPSMRRYGDNPYEGYDSRSGPYMLFQGDLPTDIAAMARVVVVGGEAWALDLLRKKGELDANGVRLQWEKGQNSALDSADIDKGRDVGNITATRDGKPIVHHITFAFVFRAFQKNGVIHQ